MEIELDPTSSAPLYQQIHDRIVEGIALGRLRRGQPLASVRQLAGWFGINPGTVVKAYDQLRAEGFIETTPKSGTTVVADRDHPTATDERLDAVRAELFTVLATARAHGLDAAALDALVAAARERLDP